MAHKTLDQKLSHQLLKKHLDRFRAEYQSGKYDARVPYNKDKPLTLSVCYAWGAAPDDAPGGKNWVRKLVKLLKRIGIDADLDQLGDPARILTEKLNAYGENDIVLVIGTKKLLSNYKADASDDDPNSFFVTRRELDVITDRMTSIPHWQGVKALLCEGVKREAFPPALGIAVYADFRSTAPFGESLIKLIGSIFGIAREQKAFKRWQEDYVSRMRTLSTAITDEMHAQYARQRYTAVSQREADDRCSVDQLIQTVLSSSSTNEDESMDTGEAGNVLTLISRIRKLLEESHIQRAGKLLVNVVGCHSKYSLTKKNIQQLLAYGGRISIGLLTNDHHGELCHQVTDILHAFQNIASQAGFDMQHKSALLVFAKNIVSAIQTQAVWSNLKHEILDIACCVNTGAQSDVSDVASLMELKALLLEEISRKAIIFSCVPIVKQRITAWADSFAAVSQAIELVTQLMELVPPLEWLMTLEETQPLVIDCLEKIDVAQHVTEILSKYLLAISDTDLIQLEPLWPLLTRLWGLYQRVGQYGLIEKMTSSLRSIWTSPILLNNQCAQEAWLDWLKLETEFIDSVQGNKLKPSIRRRFNTLIDARKALNPSLHNQNRLSLDDCISLADEFVLGQIGYPPCPYALMSIDNYGREVSDASCHHIVVIQTSNDTSQAYFKEYRKLLKLLQISLSETVPAYSQVGWYSGQEVVFRQAIGILVDTTNNFVARLTAMEPGNSFALGLITAKPINLAYRNENEGLSVIKQYQNAVVDYLSINESGQQVKKTLAVSQLINNGGLFDRIELRLCRNSTQIDSEQSARDFLGIAHASLDVLLLIADLKEQKSAWLMSFQSKIDALTDYFNRDQRAALISLYEQLYERTNSYYITQEDTLRSSQAVQTNLAAQNAQQAIAESCKTLYKVLIDTTMATLQGWVNHPWGIDDIMQFPYILNSEKAAAQIRCYIRLQLFLLGNEPSHFLIKRNLLAAFSRYPKRGFGYTKKSLHQLICAQLTDLKMQEFAEAFFRINLDNLLIQSMSRKQYPEVDLLVWMRVSSFAYCEMTSELVLSEIDEIHGWIKDYPSESFKETFQSSNKGEIQKNSADYLIELLIDDLKWRHADEECFESLYRVFSVNTSDYAENMRAQFLSYLGENHFCFKRLVSIPSSLGYRQSERIDYAYLNHSLYTISSEAQAKGARFTIKFAWMSNGQLCTRYLRAEAAEQLYDANLNEIKKSYFGNRHKVVRLVSGDVDLHFRVMPDMPLMDYAMDILHRRVVGTGTPANMLIKLVLNDSTSTVRIYPALVSTTIPGKTLKKVLSDAGPKVTFDPENYTRMVLISLLKLPGDGASRNYIVLNNNKELSCVDNEQVFVEPIVERYSFRGKYEVWMRDILFCLHQAHNPLSQAVLKEFSSQQNIYNRVSSWIKAVISQEENYMKLFDNRVERETLYQADNKVKFTPFLVLREGAIVELLLRYNYLQVKIQHYLNSTGHPTALDLLVAINIRVQKFYLKAYNAKKNPEKRLYFATDMPQASISSSQALQASLGIIPSFEDIEKKRRYRLERAAKDLPAVLNFQPDFSQVIRSDGEPEKNRQLILLKALALYPHEKLDLSHCAALTDRLLEDVVLRSPKLRILNLRACTNVTGKAIRLLEQQAPLLEELYLSDNPSLKSIKKIGFIRDGELSFSKLKVLHVSRCRNLKSLLLRVDSSIKIKRVGCPLLETVSINGSAPDKIENVLTPKIPEVVPEKGVVTSEHVSHPISYSDLLITAENKGVISVKDDRVIIKFLTLGYSYEKRDTVASFGSGKTELVSGQIGAFWITRDFIINSIKFKIHYFDGCPFSLERGAVLNSIYYRGVLAVFVCAPIESYDKFTKSITFTIKEKPSISDRARFVLIGINSEQRDYSSECVSQDQAIALAREYEFDGYFECSAKTLKGLEDAFCGAAELALEKVGFWESQGIKNEPTPAYYSNLLLN